MKDYVIINDTIHDESFFEVWCLTYKNNIPADYNYKVRVGYLEKAWDYINKFREEDNG